MNRYLLALLVVLVVVIIYLYTKNNNQTEGYKTSIAPRRGFPEYTMRDAEIMNGITPELGCGQSATWNLAQNTRSMGITTTMGGTVYRDGKGSHCGSFGCADPRHLGELNGLSDMTGIQRRDLAELLHETA